METERLGGGEIPARQPPGAMPSGTPTPDWTPWGLWATAGLGLGIFLAFVAVQFLVSIPFILDETPETVATTVASLETNAEYLATAMFASGFGCTLIILLLTGIRKGATASAYLALRWPRGRTLLGWIGIAVVFVVAMDVTTMLFGRDLATDWWMDVYAGAKSPLILGLATVVAAPLFEEAFFRGFLYAGLSRSRLGVTGAILVTAALWALTHVQYGVYEIVQIFIFGLVLGLARHRTDSLFVPLIIHAANNLAANLQVAYMI